MSLRLVRHATNRWALATGDLVRPIDATFETTGELLEHGVPRLRAHQLTLGPPRPLSDFELASPVTHPCRVIAQATNYPSHVREVGLSPEGRSNVLFRKSSASLSGPADPIVAPGHVRLLDYEVELGLVIGARTRGPMTIDAARLGDVVGALVVTNDVSARDVQVPEGQFYKGKSYRTFCPCGPILFVPSPADLARWPELRLTLRVNGELRQDAPAGDMIHRPAETLTELTTIEDLDPGDLVLTGTPGGVALAAPPVPVRAIAELLPERVRWRLFTRGQAKRRSYLAKGDRVTASIRTPDGLVDLGTQENVVG